MVVKTKTRLRWCIVFRRKATQCGSDYDINSPRNCKKGKCAVPEPRVGKSQSRPVLKIRRSLYNNVAANHIFLFFAYLYFFWSTNNKPHKAAAPRVAVGRRARILDGLELFALRRKATRLKEPLGYIRLILPPVSTFPSSFIGPLSSPCFGGGVSCRSGLLNKTR